MNNYKICPFQTGGAVVRMPRNDYQGQEITTPAVGVGSNDLDVQQYSCKCIGYKCQLWDGGYGCCVFSAMERTLIRILNNIN